MKKEAIKEKGVLEKVKAALEAEKLAQHAPFVDDDRDVIKSLQLLTMKPIMYVLNKKSGGTNLDELNDERFQKLMAFIKSSGAGYVIVDAGIEHELKDMEGEEKQMFRTELGAKDDGIDALIKAGYDLLGLETYFTTGEVETRAWTIAKNSTAPVAGQAIHTDFKEKFIRAEVIACDKLLEAGSYATAREKGWVRTEGKDYIVKDGDVIEFRV
jgi:ribosome-binding ATPase YchF (GTP1/OBG family)